MRELQESTKRIGIFQTTFASLFKKKKYVLEVGEQLSDYLLKKMRRSYNNQLKPAKIKVRL